MISIYKIVTIKNTLFLTIIVVIIGGLGILLGTSNSKVGTSVNVAEEFIKNIYTVDAVKVAEFKSLDGQTPPGANIIGEGIPKGSTTPPNEAYTKITKSLDKNIEPLMTKGGYELIVINQFNIFSTTICAKGNYTAQVTDFTLGKNVYGENDDKVRYRYEVKLKFISSDGKSEQTDSSSGAVELLKENGQWKVCLFDVTQFPKLYK